MRLSSTIVLASTNRGKLEEFKDLFSTYPEFQILSADSILTNAEKIKYAERFDTYEGNATAKCRVVNHGCHYPALADDSGLEVETLNGKPGPRSARFATPKGGQSQDAANVELLLKELQGKSNRKAKFVAVLALNIEGILLIGRGEMEGTIAETPRGKNGFGYDPIFIPKDDTRTLAELSSEEKNTISHRTKALQDLMAQAKLRGVIFAKP